MIPVVFVGSTETQLWKVAVGHETGVIFLLLPEAKLIHDSGEFIRACEVGFAAETVIKPWGSYTTLQETPSLKVKCILVNPLAALSLQSHKKRAEHWLIYKGEAKVINGDKEYLLQENETTFIPAKNKHRLINPGDSDLIIMEVQVGEYLGEDDIIRYEDWYERV